MMPILKAIIILMLAMFVHGYTHKHTHRHYDPIHKHYYNHNHNHNHSPSSHDHHHNPNQHWATTTTTTTTTTKPPVRSVSSCAPDWRPRPVHNGNRFRFNVMGANTECRDENGRKYEYGTFEDVNDVTECAEMCVNSVSEVLVANKERGPFRAIQYDCGKRLCCCLYDNGTLNNRNTWSAFDYLVRSPSATGEIQNTRSRFNGYCAKLVQKG